MRWERQFQGYGRGFDHANAAANWLSSEPEVRAYETIDFPDNLRAGVGKPVMEQLRKAELGCQVAAVVITGSGREGSGSGCTYVPKTRLMAVALACWKAKKGLDNWGGGWSMS